MEAISETETYGIRPVRLSDGTYAWQSVETGDEVPMLTPSLQRYALLHRTTSLPPELIESLSEPIPASQTGSEEIQ
jgi:hypothetical protein